MGLIKEPLVIKYGGRSDQLSQQRGLDFYRIKALLKIYKEFSPSLSPEEKLLLLSEAKNKSKIFLKGAFKHGNLRKIFELKKFGVILIFRVFQQHNNQALINYMYTKENWLKRFSNIIESLTKKDFALLPKSKDLEKTFLQLLKELPQKFPRIYKPS